MRQIVQRFTRTLAAWLSLVLVAGYADAQSGSAPAPASSASQPSAKAAPTRSGFLSDYKRLRPIKGVEGARAWRRDNVDWKKYDKVLIERMQVYLKQEGERKPIDPTDLKMLTDAFYETLVAELKPTAQIVDRPGADVLRIRIAIVDLVPTQSERSVAGTVIPFAFVAEYASGPATGKPAGSTPYLGQTGIEAQFLDGATAEILGEFSDLRVGKKYNADLSKSAPDAAQKWATGYLDSFTTWGYAKEAFKLWSKLFRERFDELRGIRSAA